MRIIGGKYKGTALASVGTGDSAAHLRPTTDRVRESLFNVLEHGDYPDISGARVLDLFAGTGALGLEALSRGAAFVQFVDDGAKANSLIRKNMDRLSLGDQARLYKRNALKAGLNRSAEFNLVFLDPPYGKGLGEKAIMACQAGNWLADGAVIVWEESAAILAPQGLTLCEVRHYGNTYVSILRS